MISMAIYIYLHLNLLSKPFANLVIFVFLVFFSVLFFVSFSVPFILSIYVYTCMYDNKSVNVSF